MADLELAQPDAAAAEQPKETEQMKETKELKKASKSGTLSRTDRLSQAIGVKQGNKLLTYAYIFFWIAALVVLIVIGVTTYLSDNNQLQTRESQNFPDAEDFDVPFITVCDNGKYNLSNSLGQLKAGLDSHISNLVDPVGTQIVNVTKFGVNFCFHFNLTALKFEDQTDNIQLQGMINGTAGKESPQLTVYLYSASIADAVVAKFNPRDPRMSKFTVAVVGSSTYDYNVQKSTYVNPPFPPLTDTFITTFPGTVAFITAEADPQPFGLEIDPSFEEHVMEQYQSTPSSAFYLVFSVVAGLWSVVTGAQEILFPMKFPAGKRELRFGGKCSCNPADMM